MQHFALNRKIAAYATLTLLLPAALLLASCGGDNGASGPSSALRLEGSINCYQSPYADFYQRMQTVINEQTKGNRQREDPAYKGVDLVVTGPPGQEKIVAYNIGIKRPLSQKEQEALNAGLAKVCPQ